MIVIKAFNDGNNIPWSLRNHWTNSIHMIRETNIKFSHIFWEGNLRTFESNFRSSKKPKNIAFKASKQVARKDDKSFDNSSDEEITLLSRQFKKYLKKKGGFQKFDKYNHSFSESKPHENVKSFDEKFQKKGDKIQCYKCHRFGHMASIFPNKGSSNRSKGKKAMNVTFDYSSSDSRSSQESEEETRQNYIAFTASLKSSQEQGDIE
ncbi:hypothetical protein BVC80_7139g3 [Macleaya cordata]|uniref:Zinc finger protein n=1 Tax=Macleaya cordata TaxID=56857 RepID=A0A200Q512_MACCD|nr:hypothetical protein BVC80_7139g3 [Macleaya cordata]